MRDHFRGVGTWSCDNIMGWLSILPPTHLSIHLPIYLCPYLTTYPSIDPTPSVLCSHP